MRKLAERGIIAYSHQILDEMGIDLIKVGLCNHVNGEKIADEDAYLLYDRAEERLIENPLDEDGNYIGYEKYNSVRDNTLGTYLQSDEFLEKAKRECNGIIISRGFLKVFNEIKDTMGDSAYAVLYDQLTKKGIIFNDYETERFGHMQLLTMDAASLNRIDCDFVADLTHPHLNAAREAMQAKYESSDVDEAFDRACELCNISIGKVDGNNWRWVVKDENNGELVKDNKGNVKVYNDIMPLLIENIEAPLKEAIVTILCEEINKRAVLDDIAYRGGIGDYSPDITYGELPTSGILRVADDFLSDKVAPLAIALEDLANYGNHIQIQEHLSFEYNPPRVKQAAVER